MRKIYLLTLMAITMVACKEKKSMELSAGIDPVNMDTTVTAGNDFYQ